MTKYPITNLLLIILTASILFSAENTNRYDLETVVYVNKKGTTYIVETVLDTYTGEVVKRRKIKASAYKLPYKDKRGKTIRKE